MNQAMLCGWRRVISAYMLVCRAALPRLRQRLQIHVSYQHDPTGVNYQVQGYHSFNGIQLRCTMRLWPSYNPQAVLTPAISHGKHQPVHVHPQGGATCREGFAQQGPRESGSHAPDRRAKWESRPTHSDVSEREKTLADLAPEPQGRCPRSRYLYL
ncbi:hypothetical protein BJV74DRAFT_459948 [Russula compacta]|nr:hypothetical protein BJV74DRAFT_459948 [Russula compacta]